MHIVRLAICGAVLVGWGLPYAVVRGAEPESSSARYFDQLRARRLFSLAEEYAASRLSDPILSPERRIELVIEWSRTLVEHALSAADAEQQTLWERAAEVLAEELAVTAEIPQKLLLEVYAALVPAARIDQLTADLEASPFEDGIRETLSHLSESALRQLAEVEATVGERSRRLEGKKPATRPAVTLVELKHLQAMLRLKTAGVLQARARLSPAGSQDRHSDLIDADEPLRKVIGVPDPELALRAKLGLAISDRLRDELERSTEILESLEREQKLSTGRFLDAIRIELARVNLQARRPHVALQQLHRMQTDRARLPGEYWMAYIQSLSALRRIASQKSATQESTELTTRAEAALKNVDAQVGAAWSRRCRSIWSTAESVERYGQRLAAALSRAEGEYLAGRVEEAITAYTSAADLASEAGTDDVELEIGHALASLLTKAGRWDEARQRCRAVVTAFPNHAKSPEIDLLGLYAAGRVYDTDRTAAHRESYLRDVRAHQQNYPTSPTASEAAFLEGQLAETASAPADAISAYQKVTADHPRATAGAAAIARCTVSILLQQRETGTRDPALEQRSLELTTAGGKLSSEKPADWDDSHIEQAYHAIKVLLLIEPPRFAEAERRLSEVDAAIAAHEEPSDLRAEIARRTGPLKLIALAGQGRPQSSATLLQSLSTSGIQEQLAAVEELSQIDVALPPDARRELIEIQLASAEALQGRREELTAAQQRRLDLALAPAYFATTQPTNAIAVYRRLFEGSANELEFTRQLGRLLAAREELGCRELARDCWRRVEKSQRQGSADWLEARARVIESCVRLGDHEQARKLFQVTKLLYPKLAENEALQHEYAALEKTLK